MTDQGKFTGWTAFLTLAGFALGLAGLALVDSDRPLATWLFAAAWITTALAFNNVVAKIRARRREHEIRQAERSRLGNPGGRP